MSINQFALLCKRRFFPLFVAQFFGAFNDNVFKNAVVILITYRLATSIHMNAQILITLAAGIFILPFFLFSATAGQLADKYTKTQLIPIIKLAEIILMVLAAAGFFLQNVTMLMTVLFLLGVQATFFGPLKYSILPDLLASEELIAGNGLIEAGTFIAILLGTIVGGVLILLPFGEYFISSAILLFSIIGFVSSLSIPKTTTQQLQLIINYNFMSETMRVIKYARERWDVYLSILGISWFWLVGAVYLAEFPVFAKDSLHSNQYVVTLFITIFSIGIAIGSLFCNRLLKGKVHATYVPLAALGMAVFGIDLYFSAKSVHVLPMTGLMSPLDFFSMFAGWHIAIDLLFIAICGGLYTVPLYAIIQERSPESHRARVIASNNIINALFMVIASVATMLMLRLGFTVLDVFLTIAIINVFFAIYICKLLPKTI